MSIVSYQQRNYRWPNFHNAVRIISEILCISWAEKELLDALRQSVCDITMCNVIEMTIYVQTVNDVTRTKKIEHVLEMITSY